jgi:glycosyltransferase involved in cell wall biosynthesis
MQVCLLIYSLSSGGAERVTATLANHWAAKGWQIVVITMASTVRDFYALDPRIKRIYMNSAIESRNPGQALFNNLRRILDLWVILRREQPEIAVSMMATANIILAVAGRLAATRTVGSERIHPPAMPLGRFWDLLRSKSYPLLDGMVAQTEASASWLKANAPSRRIRVIPNPVRFPMKADGPSVDPEGLMASRSCKHLLLAVGRLDYQKGFDLLLSAFARVFEKYNDWALVILGDGDLRQALLEKANKLGIQEQVVMPGVVGNVGEWFDQADLYVLTSRFEGFPNTLIEALAHGVASIAVDCDTGPREILRHEVDGLLVPRENSDALVSALDRLMDDASLRSYFGHNAIHARKRFSLDLISSQWQSLFEQILQ